MSGVLALVKELFESAPWVASVDEIDDHTLGVIAHDGDRLIVDLELA